MAQPEIMIGKTGSAQYSLRGMWIYRRTPNGWVQRYDTLEGFIRELMNGCLGGSWKETPEGTRIIDRFTN